MQNGSEKYDSFANELTTKVLEKLREIGKDDWIPESENVKEELRNTVSAFVSATIEKFDLVSKDEFNAQCKVLERTRIKLEELEKKIKD